MATRTPPFTNTTLTSTDMSALGSQTWNTWAAAVDQGAVTNISANRVDCRYFRFGLLVMAYADITLNANGEAGSPILIAVPATPRYYSGDTLDLSGCGWVSLGGTVSPVRYALYSQTRFAVYPAASSASTPITTMLATNDYLHVRVLYEAV